MLLSDFATFGVDSRLETCERRGLDNLGYVVFGEQQQCCHHDRGYRRFTCIVKHGHQVLLNLISELQFIIYSFYMSNLC
jgi:hypothetical protein